ncbi:hypothetical protein [Hyphomonas sp.]|uniref:hypothetical protein n=1 Tax=Hyphomonas sp. TaxID=87 RepID=UPI000C8B246B|nr:hypothetical protein [Hyphomonas sp.]MAL42734.1 hypothetical protein [Hyphomonas sp.]|tara:strand:- start:404 stop:1000 length:597 start_codon:yes stop_codon:yes gene_type:complete
MWALVENNNITQFFTRPKAITIGDINYPSNIFIMWSKAELEAIGIYEVVIDNSNLKDKEYYINTNQSFNFASETVTASYGTATAKNLADTLFTAQDETNGLGTEGEVKAKGLKTIKKENINKEANGILLPTDWMVIREADGGTAIPSNIKTWRASVRTKANSMCTQIDNASDVDALAALYEYDLETNERPLGEFPELS